MSSQPPPEGGPDRPSFAEENAMRIASESLQQYDQASDTYHVSYGPPVPAVTVHDPERGVLVRVEPRTQQVVGFSIPSFKAWYAEHAQENGEFEMELPSASPPRRRTPPPRGERGGSSGGGVGYTRRTPIARRTRSPDGG